jgi:hypothetical protein
LIGARGEGREGNGWMIRTVRENKTSYDVGEVMAV